MSIETYMTQTVSVSRITLSVSETLQIAKPAPTVVKASMGCLIEPLAGSAKDTVLGRIPDAKYRLTCRWNEDIEDGDLVTWNSARYIVAEPLRDNIRTTNRYITCILREGP